jgi:enoyl-CoA hydratase/carnithine racemase
MLAVRSELTPPVARVLALRAELLDPPAALEAGLLDELVAPDAVLDRAIAVALELGANAAPRLRPGQAPAEGARDRGDGAHRGRRL